jgi:2-polyprenyl-3-methyl-5-hydroxy-6-metoxy-1,4-benzoquinol methylase
MRDVNQEFQDTDNRKYAYDFDYILRDFILRTLKPHFVAGNALEMGCFEGVFTKTLTRHFKDLTVIEGSAELAAKAKLNTAGSPVKFVTELFEKAQFTEKFDNIFLMHTLEHLDEPISVLAKVRSWLSDQGKLFLVCPNAQAASRQIAVRMGLIEFNSAVTEGEHKHGHRKTYSLDTLENEVRQSGLSVNSAGGVFFKPLANFQFDKVISEKIVDGAYLEGCYRLGMLYPELCASIYVICGK